MSRFRMKFLVLIFLFLFLSLRDAHSQVSVKPRLGDRVYVANFLRDIFGPASSDIIQKYVLSQPKVFGGPCDPYAQKLELKKKGFLVKGGEQKCNESYFIEYRSPVLTGPSPLRSGAIINVCSKLVSCSSCISHVLDTIQEKDRKNSRDQRFKKIYRLFYPYESDDKWNQLKGFLNETQEKINSTLFIEFVCKSERWQRL